MAGAVHDTVRSAMAAVSTLASKAEAGDHAHQSGKWGVRFESRDGHDRFNAG
jgi:hypothetical protein